MAKIQLNGKKVTIKSNYSIQDLLKKYKLTNKKVAIEVQGKQHVKHVPFFHGKNKYNFVNQLRRDQDKATFCEINGITLVEIYEEDELNKKFFTSKGVTL